LGKSWEKGSVMRRAGTLALVMAALVGCDGAPAPTFGPPAAQAAAAPDLRPLQGTRYSELSARPGMENYALAALGLSEAEQARVERAMAVSGPAQIASGGGAEALVFAGCAAAGCAEGRAVLAIDLATGSAFVGVRDGAGMDELAPNDRVEALLRLSSPTRRWDDPAAPEAPAPEAAQP
jgi:hypothetical protein